MFLANHNWVCVCLNVFNCILKYFLQLSNPFILRSWFHSGRYIIHDSKVVLTSLPSINEFCKNSVVLWIVLYVSSYTCIYYEFFDNGFFIPRCPDVFSSCNSLRIVRSSEFGTTHSYRVWFDMSTDFLQASLSLMQNLSNWGTSDFIKWFSWHQYLYVTFLDYVRFWSCMLTVHRSSVQTVLLVFLTVSAIWVHHDQEMYAKQVVLKIHDKACHC